MEDLRRVFDALRNGKRLKIVVSLLESGEATVGQISNEHKLPLTTTSRHLKLLEGAGVVRTRQQGTYVYYSADTLSPSFAVRSVLSTIRRSPKRRRK
jgi:DNA-binding transcriptional ArsR family regulator